MSGHYRCLSGPRFDDAAALGYLGPERSCVVLTAPGLPGGPPVRLGVRLVVDTLLTGLWRSPTGSVWVTDRDGWVRWSDDPWPDDARWAQQCLDLAFRGIVGGEVVTEGAVGEQVWAWGARPSDGASLVRRYAAEAWRPVTAPGFAVNAVAIGGAGVWLAGADGWLARYDTDRWTLISIGREVPLTALWVGDDTVLAGGADGNIYEGGVHGFTPVAGVPAPIQAVARWGGRLWAGAGAAGLFAGVRGPLAQVRADRAARSLEAHEQLVIGCDEVLCSTPDGLRFPATGRGFLTAG